MSDHQKEAATAIREVNSRYMSVSLKLSPHGDIFWSNADPGLYRSAEPAVASWRGPETFGPRHKGCWCVRLPGGYTYVPIQTDLVTFLDAQVLTRLDPLEALANVAKD